MKKILFLTLFFAVVSLSFSKELFLKKIELEKIKSILVNDGFVFNDENTYYFFEKRNGKLSEKIDILLKDKETPYGIGIIVSCYKLETDQVELKKRLISLVEELNEGIIDKDLKDKIIDSLNKIPEAPAQDELDIIPYMKKTNSVYKNGDYYIITASRESEKNIKIIFEPYSYK